MRIATSVIAATLLATAGCGPSGTTGEVSGIVKVDGQPLEEGKIILTPVEGNGQPYASVIKDGKYSISDVPVGLMKVVFHAPGEKIEKPLYDRPGSKTRIVVMEGLPPSCNKESTYQIEVKPGPNKADYDLPGK